MVGSSLRGVTAQAVIPEQLLPYVGAVSGLRPRIFGDCVAHVGPEMAVLAGYPLHNPRDESAMNDTVGKLLEELPHLARLTVLAPTRPRAAPQTAACSSDIFWSVSLPLSRPGQKLRNMLRRGLQELTLTRQGGAEAWTKEHAALVEGFCRTRTLDAGTREIFRHLSAYLAAAPQSLLFSARREDGVLAGCALADYSSLSTAFYMFAFRRPDAPPGTADLLLDDLLTEAARRGHVRCNLGLGLGAGVTFFKQKWGAAPFLPCVETTWPPAGQKKSWLGRLFGG